jgi:hypothetical protein
MRVDRRAGADRKNDREMGGWAPPVQAGRGGASRRARTDRAHANVRHSAGKRFQMMHSERVISQTSDAPLVLFFVARAGAPRRRAGGRRRGRGVTACVPADEINQNHLMFLAKKEADLSINHHAVPAAARAGLPSWVHVLFHTICCIAHPLGKGAPCWAAHTHAPDR